MLVRLVAVKTYEVNRRHCQLATTQPTGLLAAYWSKRPAVPPFAWSSPVATTTALALRGKYQNFGSGARSSSIWPIRFASSRCCSSACGIATLFRSTQSEPLVPPKYRSSDRIGAAPSRS